MNLERGRYLTDISNTLPDAGEYLPLLRETFTDPGKTASELKESPPELKGSSLGLGLSSAGVPSCRISVR